MRSWVGSALSIAGEVYPVDRIKSKYLKEMVLRSGGPRADVVARHPGKLRLNPNPTVIGSSTNLTPAKTSARYTVKQQACPHPSLSNMSQSYFQSFSPMMFPASSPYCQEPEPSVKEDMRGDDVYVEQRDKSVHRLR